MLLSFLDLLIWDANRQHICRVASMLEKLRNLKYLPFDIPGFTSHSAQIVAFEIFSQLETHPLAEVLDDFLS